MACSGISRVFGVVGPFRRVVDDVSADIVERGLVADDVFVVVALPDGRAWGMSVLIDLFCNCGFVRTHNRTKRGSR